MLNAALMSKDRFRHAHASGFVSHFGNYIAAKYSTQKLFLAACGRPSGIDFEKEFGLFKKKVCAVTLRCTQ